MVVAVVVSVAAEARVAGVVVVLQGLLVMMVDWFVVVIRDGHRDLHRNWDGLLDRDVLLDVDWVGAIEGHLDWDWHWLLDGVGDMLLDVVGLRNRDLHWVWDGFFNRDWVGTVNWDLHWDWDGFFHGVWNGLLYRDWIWGRDMNWIGTVNRNLNFNWDLLLDGVRHWHWYFNLHGHWDVLGNFVGLWNWNLNRDGDVLLDGVRLRYQNLDGVWTIDWNVHWVRNLLLDWVRSWDMDWDLNVFLVVHWDVLHNFVWLWDWYLHWVWDVFLHSVRHMLFYGIWHWNSLKQGNGFGHIGMSSQQETVSVTVSMNRSRMVCSSQMSMSTDVSHIQTVDSVPVAQIQQTSFV